jgi:alpha-D-ribose 1-methylphosphonate 5-triphosphate diphosphatase
VLADAVTEGYLVVVDGTIDSVGEGSFSTRDISHGSDNDVAIEDCGGDYLLPGLVELHTDHLETHYMPRPGVRWNPVAAIQSHDAQIAASGITTVNDCLRMGRDDSNKYAEGEIRELADHLVRVAGEDRLRAEHYIHLRCEVSSPGVMDDYALFDDFASVKLVSLMDHAPGQRQFSDLKMYESYYRTKDGMDEEAYKKFFADRVAESETYAAKHRALIASRCRARGVCMASHDDTTTAHVNEAVSLGVSISEFPTTMDAATVARAQGLRILMGAPNVVRGGSHSGNVSARLLAENGLLDLLSSDYVPSSLLQAVFMLALEYEVLSLPDAVALVSSNPAAAAGFNDRGELSRGRKADVVRVAYDGEVPVVRSVWRDGFRVV